MQLAHLRANYACCSPKQTTQRECESYSVNVLEGRGHISLKLFALHHEPYSLYIFFCPSLRQTRLTGFKIVDGRHNVFGRATLKKGIFRKINIKLMWLMCSMVMQQRTVMNREWRQMQMQNRKKKLPEHYKQYKTVCYVVHRALKEIKLCFKRKL